MSERPTISVYVNDRIADCGYYRNYDGLELLGEAILTARFLDGCASPEEVTYRLERKAALENAPSAPEIPEYFDPPEHDQQLMARAAPLTRSGGHHPDEDVLLECEGASEFPIVIDLTRRIFYASEWRRSPSALFGDEVSIIPWRRWVDETDVDGADGWYRYWPKTAVAVSFDDLDPLMEWLIEDVANCKAAVRERATATELAKLAATDDGYVRARVAKNPNTSPETLRELSADRHWWVRKAVAGNENTPPDVIDKFAKDGNSSVRQWVAWFGNTSGEAMRLLARDPDPSVRRYLAVNRSKTPDVCQVLAHDPDPYVRRALADTIGLNDASPELMMELAHDPDVRVRLNLADNIHCTRDVLQFLLDDEDAEVRENAKRRLSWLEEG